MVAHPPADDTVPGAPPPHLLSESGVL